jgi:hypothetical protein
MTIDEAGKWAGRILGKPEAEFTFAEAFGTLLSNLEPFGIDVACVTYPKLNPMIMVVTRRAPWSGWRLGDDPKVLPQFKPGNREHVARLALEKHGKSLIFYLLFPCALSFVSAGVRDIQFVTAHGKL